MTSNDSPGLPNFFYLIVTKLDCGNHGQGNHEVVCRWYQLTLEEQEKLRMWEQWSWCVLVDCWGWVVNLYCLCGSLLEVGSLAKGSCPEQDSVLQATTTNPLTIRALQATKLGFLSRPLPSPCIIRLFISASPPSHWFLVPLVFSRMFPW